MRVIAGSAKGHNLKMPGGGKTRPAMDKVKASLFSILMPRMAGSRFLDLFAGSGSLGIEALSRGAEYAAFVDTAIQCVETIKANLVHTKLVSRGEIFREDCIKFIKRKTDSVFDIVCIDPPYSKNLLEPILENLHLCTMFSERTIFILERRKKDIISVTPENKLILIDEREFGETVLSFIKIKNLPIL
ncbi:MAG: 16S rRNA (guanine(966)-N(2))-methyltransferase RsmD [Candidatus Riflebacteria bacterium]|nr:16S rRNA (guanine(966)-N(2))-methyltransferase RsmD [Candidatus Riflebacteria bacterium]